MAELKQRLEAYFTKILELLESTAIKTEGELEQLVRVRSQQELALHAALGALTEPVTLLEILGYGATDVEDHPKKATHVGTVTYQPDYVLKNEDDPLAVLDLKAPDTSLDKAAEQISSYCEHVGAPLGVLFNGAEFRVFINPKCKKLFKYATQFGTQPVAAADQHHLKQLVDLAALFSKASLSTNPTSTGLALAKKRLKELQNQKRQRLIRDKLKEILTNPPDEILAAAAALDAHWGELEPRPSYAEVFEAWNRMKLPSVAAKQHPAFPKLLNPKIRALVAEACEAKGWEFVRTRQIKGLRHREHGGNGYVKVPCGPGVPDNLFIQGVSTNRANHIIQELTAILEGPK